jgi:ApaG protein
LINVGEAVVARQKWPKKRFAPWMALIRAMQEQLPSLQVINEHFEAIFNNATATQVINQRFLRPNALFHLIPTRPTITPMINSVKINVMVQFLEHQSRPDRDQYAFAYTITIINNGDEAVRLLNRHWTITDGNNQVQEVQGEGVIGKQPRIEPGSNFQYTSGAIIETEVGTMEGHYEMITASGMPFIAPIEVFALVRKSALH